MYEEVKDNNKLFVKLLIGSISIFIILLTIIGSLFITDNIKTYQSISLIFYYTIILIFIIIILGLFMILFSKSNKKLHPFYIKWMKLSFKLFYPLIYITGCLANIEKDKIRGEFANINNYIVSKENHKVNAGDILLLLPHCIQWSECPHKISNNIENCKMCGKCKVKNLIELTKIYGVQISIVTGGTMARNNIKKRHPKAIVAVACERDLCSGISDVKFIPVLGIINERPEGPCLNTDVNISKVEEALLYFINGGDV
jgi:hypothetical protein